MAEEIHRREIFTLADRVAEKYRKTNRPIRIILHEEVGNDLLRSKVARELQRRSIERRKKNDAARMNGEAITRTPVQLSLWENAKETVRRIRRKVNPNGC